MDIFLHFLYASLLDQTLRLRFGESGLFAKVGFFKSGFFEWFLKGPIKFQIINEREIITRRERSSQRDSSSPFSIEIFVDVFFGPVSFIFQKITFLTVL
ncbi:hypothetical protein AMTRI_Chr13g123060 [Amborella trichopoda]